MVAPAGPLPAGAHGAGLDILESRYRVVHLGCPVPGRSAGTAPPYLAADDRTRAGWINDALRNPAVEAVFCARGGYGVMRILNDLDGEALCRRPRPMVGFSDCTALHAWAAGLGVASIHGPVLTQLEALPRAHVEGLFALLEGRRLPRLRGLTTIAAGSARGPLFGGNLALLAHLCGTGWLPEPDGRILLLEEVNEPPYSIDRMLTQLELSGYLERLAGIVVGQLHRCDHDQGVPPVPARGIDVVHERLARLGVPCAAGAPVGHGHANIALPLGSPAALLDADAGTLAFDEGADGAGAI